MNVTKLALTKNGNKQIFYNALKRFSFIKFKNGWKRDLSFYSWLNFVTQYVLSGTKRTRILV